MLRQRLISSTLLGMSTMSLGKCYHYGNSKFTQDFQRMLQWYAWSDHPILWIHSNKYVEWCNYELNKCIAQFRINQNHPLPLRVDQPMNKHLSTQCRPGPKGELCCFWCPHKTWTSSLGTFDILIIVENKLKWRKLWPTKVKGVKNSIKQTTKHYQSHSRTPKKFLVCCSCCY